MVNEGFGDECGERSRQTEVHKRQDAAGQLAAL